MSRTKLKLEMVDVESFATLATDGPTGTVRALETGDCASNQATCDTCKGDNCTHGCPA